MWMRNIAIGIIVFASIGQRANAQEALRLDEEKSKIEFVGRLTGGESATKHKGGFKKFEVDCKADFEAPEKSTIVVTIDAASVFSDAILLTAHLKTADFLNVSKYPKIVFKSTKIELGEDGKVTIIGKMTMLDKEVEIKVPVTAEHTDKTLTLKSAFKIDRTLWGMNFKVGEIEKDVDVSFELNMLQK